MEILSEHACQGWIEGYLLSGRHGVFTSYEAFITIVDSMVAQYAKWLKTSREVSWRRLPASLNYVLTSHLWRQDHNGFSHQSPAFIDALLDKKSSTVRIYFPPDANTLLSVGEHCLRSRGYINVIVAPKNPTPQWLTLEAREHALCARCVGLALGEQRRRGPSRNVVLGAAGDVPTVEALAAVQTASRTCAGTAGTVRKRRRPLCPRSARRSSARFGRHRVRRGLYGGSAGRLRVPRLSTHDPRAPSITALRPSASTCADTKKKARRVRPSISWCATTRAAIILQSKQSDARGERDGQLMQSAHVAHAVAYFEEMLVRHRAYICENDTDLPEVVQWRWSVGQ